MRSPDDWWIVESDYLHPDGEDHSTDAVSYLLPPDEQQRLKSKAPFRFIGRQVSAGQFSPGDVTRYHSLGIDYIVLTPRNRMAGRKPAFENAGYLVYAL